jgi:hypothetical protein
MTRQKVHRPEIFSCSLKIFLTKSLFIDISKNFCMFYKFFKNGILKINFKCRKLYKKFIIVQGRRLDACARLACGKVIW